MSQRIVHRRFSTRGRLGATLAVAAAFGLMAGCSHSEPKARPLTPQTFYPRSQAENASPMAENPDTELVTPHPAAGVSIPLDPSLPPPNSHKAPEPYVPPPVPATGPAGAVIPRTSPGTDTGDLPKVGATSGEFLYLGTVAAEVNDTPIYANKILAMLEGPLSAKARLQTREAFRSFAADLIPRQVQGMVSEELEFATADRLLDEGDKNWCKAYTEKWRRDQIIAAGGSVELARKRAALDYADFDEQVKEQYRSAVINVYREKKIYPKVQISAQDIRDYYDRKRDTLFTERDAALWREIKVDMASVGSRQATFEKAQGIWKEAHDGVDFTTLASSKNNDDNLRAKGGLVSTQPIQRHAWGNPKVEDAVWKTPEGQVADLIDDGTAFYIVKVEKITHGHVVPFDAFGTQETIRQSLRGEQIRILHDHDLDNMRKASFYHVDEAGLQVTLDMAMQKYPLWAAGAQAANSISSNARTAAEIEPNAHFLGVRADAAKVVFVCDATGSVLEDFDSLRGELRRAVNALQPTQRCNVVFMQAKTQPTIDPDLLPATPQNKRKLVQFVDTQTPRGPSDPDPALRAAFEMRPEVIILFCDPGDFPNPKTTIEMCKNLNPDKQTRVVAIGFYSGQHRAGEDTLKQIASDSGGTYKALTAKELVASNAAALAEPQR